MPAAHRRCRTARSEDLYHRFTVRAPLRARSLRSLARRASLAHFSLDITSSTLYTLNNIAMHKRCGGRENKPMKCATKKPAKKKAAAKKKK